MRSEGERKTEKFFLISSDIFILLLGLMNVKQEEDPEVVLEEAVIEEEDTRKSLHDKY